MTQEQKAKAYDEALERAKKAIKYPDKPCFARVDEIFPELKESEDERIRKSLISYLHGLGEFEYPNKQTYNNWLTWLEKQGKHPQGKSAVEAIKEEKVDNANKVEPKLKIESGKWYMCIRELLDDYGNIAFCKGDVYWSEKDGYLIPCNSNVPRKITYCVDTYFKNWDISDAKDGDVLATDNGNICVFDGTVEDGKYPFAYCGLTRCRFEPYDRRLTFTHNNVHPATKEQRDLLFAKMKEAGYEWDAKKKELTKIEKKPYWSEEDEEHVNSLLQRLEGLCRNEFATTRFAINEEEDWLKSLKERVQPQNTWKPSEEQMDALQYIYRNLNPPLSDKLGWSSIRTLELLYNDLKKLREKQ